MELLYEISKSWVKDISAVKETQAATTGVL